MYPHFSVSTTIPLSLTMALADLRAYPSACVAGPGFILRVLLSVSRCEVVAPSPRNAPLLSHPLTRPSSVLGHEWHPARSTLATTTTTTTTTALQDVLPLFRWNVAQETMEKLVQASLLLLGASFVVYIVFDVSANDAHVSGDSQVLPILGFVGTLRLTRAISTVSPLAGSPFLVPTRCRRMCRIPVVGARVHS